MIWIIFITLFFHTCSCYNFNMRKNFNNHEHLDKKSLHQLERMFYLKNSRYNPMRNQIYIKYKLNENNKTNDGSVNITQILEQINQEFLDNYKHEIEESEKEEKELEQEFTREFVDNYRKQIEEDEREEEELEKQFEQKDDNYDKKENNRAKNPDGYVDSTGVFRYKQNIGPRIIISNQQIPEMNTGGSSGDSQFQIIRNSDFTFADVGGYNNIKNELNQMSDILLNYSKYKKFNVRTPKGIIFEGPPGNGKTLLAKGYCGEYNISFIPVSGSEFAEKYVGVGASRVRELFQVAEQNVPCIIFIDEIDALGRQRSNDEGQSNSEKDQTLNQLLVCLDGFKDSEGIFVIGATNRADLLDTALRRPGRMDKNIYFGNPDSETREAVIKIHSNGKPIDLSVSMDDLVDMTAGFSCAQVENLLNEAMLKALREEREIIQKDDLDYILNRIFTGWQNKENKYSDDIIDRIVVHEMGHAIVGFLSNDHARLSKIVLNLLSPKTPGYTLFENADEDSNIYTKNGLFTHLMVLLAGRIAEEVVFGYSVTTGARQDLEQAFGLAKNMIMNYGMGKQQIYPDMSDQSKYLIDQEVNKLLLMANDHARIVIEKSKNLILEKSWVLKHKKILKPDELIQTIDAKYPELWNEYTQVRERYIKNEESK